MPSDEARRRDEANRERLVAEGLDGLARRRAESPGQTVWVQGPMGHPVTMHPWNTAAEDEAAIRRLLG